MDKSRNFALALLAAMAATFAMAQNTPESQMEKLNRGVVVVPATTGGSNNFISWRMFGTDDDNTTFAILRNGVAIASNISEKTNYVDKSGTASSAYQIVTKQDGVAIDTTEAVSRWSSVYKTIQLDRPAEGTTPSGDSYTYTPNDCSVGDVDGDGEYEIVVKWDPSNSKDNSQSGYTGNVYLDCYKLDATKLWRIDLGKNIRAGAHYTQFLVYDFDCDGKAELICKTAPGSIDGTGVYVNQAATDEGILSADNTVDWRNSSGKIKGGQEYLTVFNGYTGKAIHTIYYNPNRATGYGGAPTWTFNWDDRSGKTDTEYGNRGERYLATVAYLAGADERPSAVMCRGYYTYAFLWAVDFDGEKLQQRWLHSSKSKTSYTVTDSNGDTQSYTPPTATRGSGSNTAYSNGNHNLSCADVDGDGCDEIVWGSCAIDQDGTLLYATGYGHGDAMHLSDLVPDRPGLEVFEVHEGSPYGWDVHDAATGEILLSSTGSSDNGRGLAADVDQSNRGFEFWSSNDGTIRSATTGEKANSNSGTTNFRAYWDGDLLDELLDGGKMDKVGSGRIYPTSSKNFYSFGSSCNSTKATPNLSADILGDWREEIILHGDDNLVIFTTNVESDYRAPTLMHDHVYRLGVAWQNVAYNQPPHLGYYLPDLFKTQYVNIDGYTGEFIQEVALGDSIETICRHWKNCASPSLIASIAPDGTDTKSTVMEGFKFTKDVLKAKTFKLEGKPTELGTYKFVIKSGKNNVDATVRTDTIVITCVNPTGIANIESGDKAAWAAIASGTIDDGLTLKFNVKNGTEQVRVSIYDAAGSKVGVREYSIAGTATKTISGLGRLQSGVYLVKVESSTESLTKKVIKR